MITQPTPEMQLTALLAQYSDLKVMRDILIPADDKTMHIDFLILTRYGIFICELKSFRGIIQGEGMKKYWKQFTDGNEIDYFSPLLQNLYHMKFLKKFLEPLPFETYLHSVVYMFGLGKTALQIRPPYPPQSSIVNSIESLQRVIQLICEKKNVTLPQAEVDYIFEFIGKNQIRGDDARAAHEVQAVKYKNDARKALYRQICPECGAPIVPQGTPTGNYWVCSRWPDCTYTHKM
ncbi:MAG: NERD domain-containing protein [Oscillospiraceae bacterium]|nr:NERD domain-containing protein [Oscillospiraceae bacterium]MCR4761730.1 NERD domain-containing protein [Oscillospiraceae bacterium]